MKKHPIFLGLAFLSASGLSSFFAAFTAPAQAQPATVRFICAKDAKGVPTTMVAPIAGKRAPAPVIRWTSNYFGGAGFTPARRCAIVSQKFQEAYTKNANFVFTTAIYNGEPVVCSSASRGGACDTVLYTVKRGVQDPILTMMRLEKVRTGAAGPLNESSAGGAETELGVQDLIKNLLESSDSSSSSILERSPQQSAQGSIPKTRALW